LLDPTLLAKQFINILELTNVLVHVNIGDVCLDFTELKMKLQGRIYELSKEAGFTGKYDFPYGENLNPAIQKFAELIVQECMNVVDTGENQLIARFQARQWLAEHFEVE